MIAGFHELRRSEDGQALVLGAVFGLVLMLCVLGTVNLGRAVYDKVQLQAAADAAAYSQAAVEARVMNFTAYTNRAMVVHYASLMAATTYLTYIHFEWVFLEALLEVARYIPYIGGVFATMQQILKVVVTTLDVAVAALAPLLTAANIVLYGLQEGAWWSVYLGRLARALPPEAHSGDSPAHPYQAIWPHLIPAANQAVFAQTRGHVTMPQNTAEAARILLNHESDAVQLARLHMLEVANSARQPWVATGDRSADPSASPMARHFQWRLVPGHLWYGSHARTELGTFPPGSGASSTAQIWSGQQAFLKWQFKAFGISFAGTRPIFTFVGMDQIAPSVSPFKDSYFRSWRPGAILGVAFDVLVPGLGRFFDGIETYANRTLPSPDKRLFTLTPYVSFSPRANSKPGLGPFGALGNFGQPDVLVGLAKDGRDANAEPAAARTYRRRFSWDGEQAGHAAVEFRSTAADGPRLPGMPRDLQLLHEGQNAFAAAQVYYHRPGDWKEMPNLFNPLWGARLMPVTESNVAARLGLTGVPLLQKLLLH